MCQFQLFFTSKGIIFLNHIWLCSAGGHCGWCVRERKTERWWGEGVGLNIGSELINRGFMEFWLQFNCRWLQSCNKRPGLAKGDAARHSGSRWGRASWENSPERSRSDINLSSRAFPIKSEKSNINSCEGVLPAKWPPFLIVFSSATRFYLYKKLIAVLKWF